jgi:alpha-tubulin suppressor-like RCC1 family protein
MQLTDPTFDNVHLSGESSPWRAALTVFGTAGQRGTPGAANLLPLGGGARIDAEVQHTCMVDLAGQAWCWGGTNQYGELGIGTTTTPADRYAQPVQQPAGVTFADVRPGNSATCALSLVGQAYCWGLRVALGNPSTAIRYATPAAVPQGGMLFSKLGGMGPQFGATSTCALDPDGQVWCWGSNGQQTLPTRIPQPAGISFTSISLRHSFGGSVNGDIGMLCGVTAAGQAYCRGTGAAVGADIPDGVTIDTFAAVRQPNGVRFTTISTNSQNTCALSTLGQAFCWGLNYDGQVGDGTKTHRYAPVAVQHPASVRFTDISVGSHLTMNQQFSGNFVCAVATSGQAYCWGTGQAGQLGTGTISSVTPAPVAQPAGVLFSKVAAGEDHVCAIAGGHGDVYCWGSNANGLLGDGTTTNHPTPVNVIRRQR